MALKSNGQPDKTVQNKFELVQIFAVEAQTESDVGNSRKYDHSHHSTEERAIAAAQGVSAWGRNGTVVERQAVHDSETDQLYLLGPSIELDVEDRREEAKDKAKSKLSPEEQALLGIE